MKKKVLSLFLALCMCLTLLPAQAFAAEAGGEGTHTHTAQPTGTNPVYAVEGDTDSIDSAVLAVKAMIDALPAPAKVTAADYDAVAAAYDAFCALNEDQMAAVDNAEKLLALTSALTGGTQPLAASADDVASFTTAGENPTTTYYISIEDAFTAINGAANSGTLTLLKDVDYASNLEFTQKNVTLTLDLNGQKLNLKSNSTLILKGSGSQYTVKNGTIKSSSFAINTQNRVNVTLENVTAEGNTNGTAGTVTAGRLSTFVINSGNYRQLQVNSSVATLTINGGTFTSIADSSNGSSNSTTPLSADQYGKILGDGCAYRNTSTDSLISYKNMNASTPVKVVAHAAHAWTAGACACGAVCNHPSINEQNKCTKCEQDIYAKVTITGSDDTFYYLTVDAAVEAAKSGGTVTLLATAQWGSGDVTAPTGAYTIDLNSNNLNIGGNGSTEAPYRTLTIPQGANVTFKYSSAVANLQGPINCSGVTVATGGFLTLDHVSTHNASVTVSGSLTLGAYGECKDAVTVESGGNVTLNGSSASVNGTLTAKNGSTVELNDQNATIVTLNAETGSTVTLYGKVTTLNAQGGNVTITGGTVSGAVNISGGTVNLTGERGTTISGTLNVTSGTLNCGTQGNVKVEGNVTISGGTVTTTKGEFTNNSNTNTMTISNGNVTIGGGTFNNVTVNGGALSVNQTEAGSFTLTPQFNGDVTIGGGTVTIGAWDSNSNSHTLTINGGDVAISGGSFIKLETTVTGKTLANYLATGSRVSKSTQPQSRQSLTNSMSNITVESCTGHAKTGTDMLCDYCDATLVATVTTPVEGSTSTVKYYDTFSDAVKGSAEGDTITLLQNVSISNTAYIRDNRTLDLNGKTLTGNVTLYGAPTITGNGKIDGTLTIGSANRPSVPAKIMNGTFTKLVNYSNCAKLHGGTFGEITYSGSGSNLGSLLADGKGFKKEDGGTLTWYDKDSTYPNSLTNVSVADLPIQSVDHNFTWVTDVSRWRLYVDYGAPLKAQITGLTLATGYSQNDVTYKWYDQQRNLVTSVTGSTYDMGTANATAPTGFTCEISLDGYTKKYTVFVNLRNVDLVPGTHFRTPIANTLTYNGHDQVLIGAGENLLTGESLNFQYRLNDTNAASVSNAADVKAKNAATYTVYYTVSADTNYYNAYTGSDKYITVTIAPKTVTATVSVVGGPFTYTGSAIEPAVTVKDGDTDIPETEYTVSYSNNTAAGIATITVTDKTGGNYTVSGSTTFTIGHAASSVVTAPTANTVTGEDGTTLRITTTTLPDGTVEESWEVRIPEGKEAVTVPGTITIGGAGNTSHAIDIILPEGAGETDVQFRVSDVTSGTVVILVHEDGTEEVLHDTVQTESGVRITVRGNMRVKIGDRSMTFSDIAGHWAEDDVNYVAARGLFVGIGNGKFGVGLEATRGTVLTVLARLAGVDTNGGATWYEKGVQWAVKNGISDGTNPNDSITREQLAAMLYRFILLQGGKYEGELNLALRYSDAQQASDWACEALCWCTEHRIQQGRKDGSLDPQGTATREEIAAMLARFLQLV